MGKLDDRLKKSSASIISSADKIRATELAMDTKASSSNHAPIPLDKIDYNPDNLYRVMDDDNGIEQLADAIEKSGLLHNIVVSQKNNGRYLLLSGERRVRAINYLHDKEVKENKKNAEVGLPTKKFKWITVQAEILTGLESIDEQIILDEANLMARGGYSGEAVVAKCMKRYMDNLKNKYGISTRIATAVLINRSSYCQASVYRYIKVANDLGPELCKLFDAGLLSHDTALSYCSFSEDEQKVVANALNKAREPINADGEIDEKFFSDVVKRALRATKLYDTDREDALATLLMKRTATKPDSTVLPQMEEKRAKYIQKYSKIADDIHAFASPRKVKSLQRLEEGGGEGSIVDQLDRIIQEAQALKNKIMGVD